MEELQKDFDNFLLDAQMKGYSLKTIMAWLRQRVIVESDSIPIEPPVIPQLGTKEKAKIFLQKYRELQSRTFYIINGEDYKRIDAPKLEDVALQLLEKLST